VEAVGLDALEELRVVPQPPRVLATRLDAPKRSEFCKKVLREVMASSRGRCFPYRTQGLIVQAPLAQMANCRDYTVSRKS
jgi:hypothetical protein